MSDLKRIPLIMQAHLNSLQTKQKFFAQSCAIAAMATLMPTAQAIGSNPVGTAGNFSIVPYNIAGLPKFLGSTGKDPAKTTPEMGRRLLRFDVVNVQEDLNYHAAL